LSNARRQLRKRFWAETILGSFTAIMFILTFAWRDWIETVFRVDPDHGDGSLEWMIVAGLFVLTTVLAVLARMEWKRSAVVAT
jgi:hypothetical protein